MIATGRAPQSMKRLSLGNRSKRERLSGRGRRSAPAQNVQVEPPKRQVVGTDGVVRKMPVRPAAAPVMPQRKPKHVVPVDRYGTEIPVGMEGAFEDGVLADVASTISKARVALRHGIEDRHPAFAAVRQDALVQLVVKGLITPLGSNMEWCVAFKESGKLVDITGTMDENGITDGTALRVTQSGKAGA